MPEVGDRIEVASLKAGRRVGVVTATHDQLLTVRWDSGEESSLIPGPGVLSVVGRSRGRKTASRQATAAKKTQGPKSPAVGSSSKTRAPGSKVAAPKQTAVTNKAASKKTVAKKPAKVATRKQTAVTKKAAAPPTSFRPRGSANKDAGRKTR